MKKLALIFSTIAAILISAGVVAGGVNPVSPPNSNAFGKSLDEWMGIYWRQYLTLPNVVGEKNVTFPPIVCPDPAAGCNCAYPSPYPDWHAVCEFNITVAPGTPLVLPFFGWLAYSDTDYLPPECFGQLCNGPAPVNLREVFADATLDGRPIAEPSAAFYVGPTPFEPPIQCTEIDMCVLYQAIGVAIKPLTPGVHKLVLHSGMWGQDFPGPEGFWGYTYDNTWNITVLPPGKK
jgi:hypothetical protein